MRYLNFISPKFSFLSGMGSAFDITGNYYTFDFPKTSEEAFARDSEAINSDWQSLGVIFSFEKGNEEKTNGKQKPTRAKK